MLLSISNGTKWQRKHTKNFLEWFAKNYLDEKTTAKLNVSVKLSVSKEILDCKDDLAYCETIKEKSGKEKCIITIYAPANMSFFRFLSRLAHETVHMKQYITGELRYTNDATIYKKKVFLDKDLEKPNEYWNYPWEIEAMGREIGLVKLYSKENKIYKKVFTSTVKRVLN